MLHHQGIGMKAKAAKANDTNAIAAGDGAKLQGSAKSRKTREMQEWRVAEVSSGE